MTLPKIIPLNSDELFLSIMYKQLALSQNKYQERNVSRDFVVIELLFATGMRISELCSLTLNSVNLTSRAILIYEKRAKERITQIGNTDVHQLLCQYVSEFQNEIRQTNSFYYPSYYSLYVPPHICYFIIRCGSDVDIRYIQEMLRHSSINITEIYTHVASVNR